MQTMHTIYTDTHTHKYKHKHNTVYTETHTHTRTNAHNIHRHVQAHTHTHKRTQFTQTRTHTTTHPHQTHPKGRMAYSVSTALTCAMEASGTMPACGEKEEGSVFVFAPWRHLERCQPVEKRKRDQCLCLCHGDIWNGASLQYKDQGRMENMIQWGVGWQLSTVKDPLCHGGVWNACRIVKPRRGGRFRVTCGLSGSGHLSVGWVVSGMRVWVEWYQAFECGLSGIRHLSVSWVVAGIWV